jgi:hypothetical protein
MKKLSILLILVGFALSAKAQGAFDFGLKAGMNTSKISTNMADYTPKTISSYQFGAFARINLGRFYIQPEAYSNSKKGEVVRVDNVGLSTINSFNLKTIDVPALLGFKILDQKAFNLRVLAGPVFSFLTDKSAKGQLTEDNLKNSFFGWQYGVGLDFLILSLDIRKEQFSSNLYDTPNFDFDTKNGTFVISLGVKF